jgi:hypothetical protein
MSRRGKKKKRKKEKKTPLTTNNRDKPYMYCSTGRGQHIIPISTVNGRVWWLKKVARTTITL